MIKKAEVRNLEVIVTKEGNQFVPYIPALDLTSVGDTLEEAHKNIAEALELFIEGCIEKGTLEKVLEDCGWKKTMIGLESHLVPPSIIESFHTQIAIPA